MVTFSNRNHVAINVLTHIERYGSDKNFVPNEHSEDFLATHSLPGSQEKIRILAERVRKGLPLWHKHDRSCLSKLRDL